MEAENYFNIIPDEIIIKILSFLPTKDLISISQTYLRFGNASKDKSLLHCIDLRASYGFKWSDISSFLRCNSYKKYIQHVHIDHCYWMNWSQDARFLRSCCNLKSLTLMGVPVTLSQLLPVFFACEKIKYLAFTYNNGLEESDKYNSITALHSAGALKNVTKLHLMLDQSGILPPPLFWEIFINLEELILIFSSRVHQRVAYLYEDTIFSLSDRGMNDNKLLKLKKFITTDMTGKLYLTSYSRQEKKRFPDVSLNRGLDRAFLTRWSDMRNGGLLSDANGNALMGPSTAILYRLPENLQPWAGLLHMGIILSAHLPDTLARILRSCPEITSLVIFFNYETTELLEICSVLFSNQSKLEKLSIVKKSGFSLLLDLQNLELTNLTHLSLPSCAINHKTNNSSNDSQTSIDNAYQNGFKKPRLGVSDVELTDLLPLGLCITGCPNITVLEIGISECEEMKLTDKIMEKLPPKTKSVFESLVSIKNLLKLKNLTLHNLPIRNGSFLIQIFQNCKNLSRVRLKDLGPSGLCCYSRQLCQALAHCGSLVDFRIEQNNIAPCRELFHAISTHCEKLQRLVIISPGTPFTSYALSDIIHLLKSANSLVFAYFKSDYWTQRDDASLQRTAKGLRKTKPELFVFHDVTNRSELQEKRNSIPLCHLMEMVEINSWTRFHNLP